MVDAGVGIDLHLADVHARREGEVGRIEERAFLQARLQLLAGELVGDVGLQRDLAEGRASCRCRATEKLPSLNSMSSSGTSSTKPATFLALTITLSSALEIADMPTAPEREP